MTFELGVYSFGNTPRIHGGGYGATAQAIRDVLEAVHIAEEVGLDFFGFGEHHTQSMPLSSPSRPSQAADRPRSPSRSSISTSATTTCSTAPSSTCSSR